jgi:hypothetical protein
MSLFNEFKKLAGVYHPDETNGKVSYPATPDDNVYLVIQTMSPEDRMVFGDTYGDYVTYTPETGILRGDKIVCEGKAYYVTDYPTYIKLFKEYKIFLRAEK